MTSNSFRGHQSGRLSVIDIDSSSRSVVSSCSVLWVKQQRLSCLLHCDQIKGWKHIIADQRSDYHANLIKIQHRPYPDHHHHYHHHPQNHNHHHHPHLNINTINIIIINVIITSMTIILILIIMITSSSPPLYPQLLLVIIINYQNNINNHHHHYPITPSIIITIIIIITVINIYIIFIFINILSTGVELPEDLWEESGKLTGSDHSSQLSHPPWYEPTAN